MPNTNTFQRNDLFKFTTSVVAKLKRMKRKSCLKLTEYAENLHLESCELHVS